MLLVRPPTSHHRICLAERATIRGTFVPVVRRIKSEFNTFRKMFFLCFYSLLVRPRPIIHEVKKRGFSTFALALQEGLIYSLSDLLT